MYFFQINDRASLFPFLPPLPLEQVILAQENRASRAFSTVIIVGNANNNDVY